MELYKPSLAKILSIPAFFVLLLFLVSILISYLFPDTDLVDALYSYGLLILLVVSYILSCFIWDLGGNHRRILIAVFTLLNVFSAYFVVSLVISFFGLCLSDLGLPCGPDLGPCPAPRPCPLPLWANVAMALPIIVLIVGIVLFIKEGKKKTSKSKINK